jgi:pimeloyl-ACP methyl ester carboxylesterase
MVMVRVPGAPFKLKTDVAMLAEVIARVKMARLPAQQAGDDWQTGTPLSYVKRLRDYWLESFDWNTWVERINAFEHRIIDVRGERIHAIVEQGSGGNPVPLVLTHGWPGSFIEFLDIIDRLAHPERHGGSEADAFTVIVPSLPGYGFSPAPSRPLAASQIAGLWSAMMVEAFGVDRYVAYGSDWGSLVTAAMAFDHPERLAGIMVTTSGVSPDLAAGPALTEEEQQFIGCLQVAMQGETGYQAIQGTKPQTLAYAHTDSPIGLAAWIVEKFQGWSVPRTQQDPPFTMDVLLANVMLYWIGEPLAPTWLYMFLDSAMQPRSGKAKVRATFMLPPDDLFPPAPRSWVERSFDVADYSIGGVGHFPGLDSPDLLIAELRRMLLPLARA